MQTKTEAASLSKPLCVDCDGTLIKTDLLYESALRFLVARPWKFPELLVWTLRGPAHLKSKLASVAPTDCTNLPYRQEVLDLVRRYNASGQHAYLVTAAHKDEAERVASFLKLFAEVIASDSTRNLKADRKEDSLINKFGAKGYDYAGDARADIPVWRSADRCYVAGATDKFFGCLKELFPGMERIGPPHFSLGKMLSLMRLHQWAKNLLIFVPLVTSHQIFNPAQFVAALLAFLSFGFVASATYIANDLFDLEHDRAHRSKSRRPLADGSVSVPVALAMALVLAVLGLALAAFLPWQFAVALGVYVLLTLGYSLCLKRVAIADVVALAALYTLRLLAGHGACHVQLSIWLLAFSVFIFFSLALAKRYVEVADSPTSPGGTASGRDYCRQDAPLIGTLGATSGVVSVLVVILYISSPEVLVLYERPIVLVVLAPLFLYWVSRLWLFAFRGKLHEDPVVFALRDGASYACAAAAFAIMFLAKYA